MGQSGHYPLFDTQWFYESFQEQRPLNQKEKVQARKILQRLLNHKSFDRQKTLLLSLSEEERMIFLRSFCHMVEGKILDDRPQLH